MMVLLRAATSVVILAASATLCSVWPGGAAIAGETATSPASPGEPPVAAARMVPPPHPLAAAGTPSASLQYTLAWKAALDVNADSSPVVLPHVRFPGGAHRAVVYVLAGNTTLDCSPIPADFVKASTLYAFDAGSGTLLWQRSMTGPGRCTTASPAAAGNWVYSPGLDGKVHKYAAATGAEYLQGGWPMPFTVMPFTEKSSAALVISGRYLYVTVGGFAHDLGHYQGHLVTIDLTSGHVTVFNALCSSLRVLLSPTPGSPTYCPDAGSAMWGRGEAAVDPVSKDVYVVTGNGPWNGTTDWGDSILKLSPDGSRLLDSFTPANQAFLNDKDQDLGSTGPAMLPPVEVNGTPYHLMVQAGKGPALDSLTAPRELYLINRDELGGQPGPGHLGGQLQAIDSPGKVKVLTQPAVWTDPQGNVWVVYANQSDITAYSLDTSGPGAPQLVMKWDVHRGNANFTTPLVSQGVLYVAQNGAIGAYDPATGQILWSSTAPGAGGTVGHLHWEYPAVGTGMLFMTDETGHLYAYRRSLVAQPSAGSALAGAACASARDCWAVGYQTSARTGAILNQALHWDGASWSEVVVPSPPGGDSSWLAAVTCTSDADCWAVGDYATNFGNTNSTQALHWDGTTWSLVPMASPAGTVPGDFSDLSGISCASSRDCWAVGFSTTANGNTFHTLAFHWDGTAWTPTATPNPAGTQGEALNYLSAVSCPAAGSCWAVGYGSANPGLTFRNEALHWNGVRWAAVSAPSRFDSHLNAVACVSVKTCWAVGYYIVAKTGARVNEMLRRAGASWSPVPTSGPAAASRAEEAVLQGVACSSAASCWAVGYQTGRTSGASTNEAFRWTGSAWSTASTSSPADATSGQLSGVACVSAGDCWAVGTYQTENNDSLNEVLRRNGSRWSPD